MIRTLRTIRLDASDSFIFECAAEAGEWAVPGSFRFWDADPSAFAGKQRAAFRSGFLGLSSYGWSTLSVVVEANEAERGDATTLLADRLVRYEGAPDLRTAMAAAQEEVDFASSLAQHPVGTLVALARRAENGRVREQFRTLKPRQGLEHERAFHWLRLEGEDDEGEGVDLVRIARGGG